MALDRTKSSCDLLSILGHFSLLFLLKNNLDVVEETNNSVRVGAFDSDGIGYGLTLS
jgi:hypothetical protein